jgi:beta-lactam-binding protein with PASTA domain
MVRFLRIVAQLLFLVIVALASALVSMRLAIHGREVKVPELRGLVPAEAERVAAEQGLEFSRSDHFYSATVPVGRILSQQPEPGTLVRRGWRIQAAESLGAQMTDIPELKGMSPRAAEIDIRRRGLELDSTAELPSADAPPQAILAQSPAAGAKEISSPRVSLLYAGAPPEAAWVMPDLNGMSLREATEMMGGAGLKVGAVSDLSSGPSHPGRAAPSIVVGQSPQPGSRVTASSTVALQIVHLGG